MTTSAPQVIEMAFDLAKPPATVWRALTEPALLAKWVMPNDIVAVVGHAFTFRSEPQPGWDGIIQSTVLEVVPHEKLAYTWVSGGIDTVVTWSLAPTPDGGTRLQLSHAGFQPSQGQAAAGANWGWKKFGATLAEVLATLG